MRQMTFLGFLTYALWVFPLVLQVAIMVGMVRRKLVKSFPVFFSYTAVVFFSETGLLFFATSGNLYHRLYSYKEAIAIILGFAVIFEILRHILPPYSSPKFVLSLVLVLAGLFAVTALLMFVLAKPAMGSYSTFEFILRVERSVRFLQASLLIVVIALMSVLGLSWQYESLGILAGFGVYSAVALVAFQCGALHWMNPIAFSILNSAGYNVAALIWAFYVLRSRGRKTVERLPNADLTEWNDALNNFVNQQTRGSRP